MLEYLRVASTKINIHTYMYTAFRKMAGMYMIVHIHIAANPLPCGKALRGVFIGMGWQKHVVTFQWQQNFEVQHDFKKIYHVQ